MLPLQDPQLLGPVVQRQTQPRDVRMAGKDLPFYCSGADNVKESRNNLHCEQIPRVHLHIIPASFLRESRAMRAGLRPVSIAGACLAVG